MTLLITASAYGQHIGDVWVGVTPQGQLAPSTNGYIPQENFKALTPVNSVIHGWSDVNPGFDHVVSDDELDPLSSGAEIWLEVVDADPAFQAIDDGFQFLHDPGDDTLLGGSTMHEHITWYINDQDPMFDENQCVWYATFVLRDDGSTNYQTSEPLEFAFTNVPLRPAGEDADGDFDGSGVTDDDDAAGLSACLDGPGWLPDPDDPSVTTCVIDCLNAFDFDNDRDVDLADVAAFQLAASPEP